MKPLRRHLAQFLIMRRSLGFRTKPASWLLSTFVSYLESKRMTVVTTEQAVAWAKRPVGAHPMYWGKRLSTVRVFARYLHELDRRHQVPPPDALPAPQVRTTPTIFTPTEIEKMLSAVRALPSSGTHFGWLRRATYETLFGLIAVTGVRVGEAIRLDLVDVDFARRCIVIRESKFRKSRQVFLHDSAVRALHRYARNRDLSRRARCDAFFVSVAGTRLIYNNVHATFARTLARAGIVRPRARLHDLRHTFAVRTILRWYEEGVDVDARIAALSTHLGHSSPSSTYWYLSATPELMAVVGKRMQRTLGVLP